MSQVVVVVPARDESGSVAATVRDVAVSVDLARHRGLVSGSAIEVVAHRCLDDTADRARAALAGRADATVTRDHDSVSVGQVRDRGVRRALPRLDDRPGDTWVLSTDADTRVGATWVTDILTEAARTRVVAVVGLAPLDAWRGSDIARTAYAAVLAEKMRDDPVHQHDHVYGANLAVRADAYLAVGGFSHLVHGEDQRIVDDLDRHGFPLLRTRHVTVTTSGRLRGRAVEGLAAHLARLDLDPVPWSALSPVPVGTDERS